MDILRQTPYLLSQELGQRVIDLAIALRDDVRLLRQKGSLDSQTLQQLRRDWRFKDVYESAGIEGNELSLSETKTAIQRGITISGKPPEHSDEVRNLNEALEYLESLVSSASPPTEWELRQVHKLILGRDNPGGGAYRNVLVEITNSPHKPPHPLKVPEQMKELAGWLGNSSDIPVPLVAAVAHAWLAHIHPFRDGNGRTARALMNLILMRHGYPIVIIRRTDRQRYYESLRASDDGDITSLLELIVERCDQSLREIDRVRQAVTGLSIQLQRVDEQEELRYRNWADGIRLLGSTLEDIVSQLSVDHPQFGTRVVRYDVPDFDDYKGICTRDPSCNTWFMKIQIGRSEVWREVLLWIGFSSIEATLALGISKTIPTIKLSIRNTTPPPTWVLPDARFSMSTREIGYLHGTGQYARVNATEPSVQYYDNVVILATEFVTELIGAWFGDS